MQPGKLKVSESWIERAGLRVALVLDDFVNNEALPGSGVDATEFWTGLSDLIDDKSARNRQLLEHRSELQAKIDTWHRENRELEFDQSAYLNFLQEIHYIEPEGDNFSIRTE